MVVIFVLMSSLQICPCKVVRHSEGSTVPNLSRYGYLLKIFFDPFDQGVQEYVSSTLI